VKNKHRRKLARQPTLAEWPLDQVVNREAKKKKKQRRQTLETVWDQPLCTQPNLRAQGKKMSRPPTALSKDKFSPS
jgi:hypothetical protein